MKFKFILITFFLILAVILGYLSMPRNVETVEVEKEIKINHK